MIQYAFKTCKVSNEYCPNAVFLKKLTKNMLPSIKRIHKTSKQAKDRESNKTQRIQKNGRNIK